MARGRPTWSIAGSDMGSGLAHDSVRRHARVMHVGLLEGRDRLDALAAASVVVYPSRHEVFGLVPLEALLSGSPVIVCNDSGAGEIIRTVGGGQIVPVGDVDVACRRDGVDDRGQWHLAAARAHRRACGCDSASTQTCVCETARIALPGRPRPQRRQRIDAPHDDVDSGRQLRDAGLQRPPLAARRPRRGRRAARRPSLRNHRRRRRERRRIATDSGRRRSRGTRHAHRRPGPRHCRRDQRRREGGVSSRSSARSIKTSSWRRLARAPARSARRSFGSGRAGSLSHGADAGFWAG